MNSRKKVRTFARMMLSLIEEAQAIDWHEQRMAVEKDKSAKAIMANGRRKANSNTSAWT